jgi:hypothetical protein
MLDPLKLIVKIVATTFLTEPTYMRLNQLKSRESHSKNVKTSKIGRINF